MSEFRNLALTISSEVLESAFPSLYRVMRSQVESEDRAFQESRRGLEEAQYANRALNRELQTTAVQVETLEALTGRLLLELESINDNIRLDWDDAASGLFAAKSPKVKEGTKKKPASTEKSGKVKPKMSITGAGKFFGAVGLVTLCFEMVDRVKKLDPDDPKYYDKVRAEVVALTNRHAISTIAAILGAIAGTAAFPGFGTIAGLVAGLAAGMYVDYAFGDSVEEITKQLIEYLLKDSPEKIPKATTPTPEKLSAADLPSSNATEVAFTPALMRNVTKMPAEEITAVQKNWLESLIEGNFKSLSFEAGTITFDADFIDWGPAGAPQEGGDVLSATVTPREDADVSKGTTPKSKMPNIAPPGSSGVTPQSTYAPHTPNATVKPSSGVTPQSGALGGSQSTTTPKDWSGHTYTGDYADILATIRDKESSGGNYTARSSSSSASGAYQFINSTWRRLTEKFGIGQEYRTAADAPPQIQDAVAAAYVADILRRNNNDLSKVPLEWYTGNSAGIMSPTAIAANNGQTGNAYVDDWMRRYQKISGKSPEMVENRPQTGNMMNATAVTQNAREAQESQPKIVPTMARSAAPSGVSDERSTDFMKNRRDPTAAQLFKSLFNLQLAQ